MRHRTARWRHRLPLWRDPTTTVGSDGAHDGSRLIEHTPWEGTMPRNVRWLDEQTMSKDLIGKVYIVTGANSG